MHIIFFPQSKSKVIFDTGISYQSKQHPSFKCNEIWSRNADRYFNLLLWTVKGTRVPSLFSSSALDNKCFLYTSFSYSFILFFFSTLSKSKHPPEQNFLPCTIWGFHYPISPYFCPISSWHFHQAMLFQQHKTSFPCQGPPGFRGITAAEKRDQVMIPVE